MTPDELVAAVEAPIGTLSSIYKGAADESDLYEAALLTIALQATRLAEGTPLLTEDGVVPTTVVTFRRGPGNLWAPGFTHASVRFPGIAKELEIHLGIKVAGVSGVAHECDVAVIDSTECDRSRAGGVHPRRSAVIAALEAKHYHVSPGLDIGRGFLGLGTEIGGTRCSLVFPGQASANLQTLIARKTPECFPEVEPGSSAGDRLCHHIEQRVRNWLP